MAIRQVQKELKGKAIHATAVSSCPEEVQGQEVPSVEQLKDDGMFNWTGTLLGPESIPYEGGQISLDPRLPRDTRSSFLGRVSRLA
jgi:ubiquitin-protein ligase